MKLCYLNDAITYLKLGKLSRKKETARLFQSSCFFFILFLVS